MNSYDTCTYVKVFNIKNFETCTQLCKKYNISLKLLQFVQNTWSYQLHKLNFPIIFVALDSFNKTLLHINLRWQQQKLRNFNRYIFFKYCQFIMKYLLRNKHGNVPKIYTVIDYLNRIRFIYKYLIYDYY